MLNHLVRSDVRAKDRVFLSDRKHESHFRVVYLACLEWKKIDAAFLPAGFPLPFNRNLFTTPKDFPLKNGIRYLCGTDFHLNVAQSSHQRL
jgi:hypothetical protein